jgi:DNA polymerase-3 subunit epsilon
MRIMFFDTETTDLLKITGAPLTKQPRVTEFYGIVHNERAEQVDMLHFLCDPKQPLTPLITKITGLRDIDLVGKPEFPAYAKQVKTLIESVDEVVAHNLRFDMDVVGHEFARIPSNEATVKWPQRQICTVEQTVYLKGHALKMGDLYEHLFGERFLGAHRAKADTDALAKCYWHMKERNMI